MKLPEMLRVLGLGIIGHEAHAWLPHQIRLECVGKAGDCQQELSKTCKHPGEIEQRRRNPMCL